MFQPVEITVLQKRNITKWLKQILCLKPREDKQKPISAKTVAEGKAGNPKLGSCGGER